MNAVPRWTFCESWFDDMVSRLLLLLYTSRVLIDPMAQAEL